MKLLYMILFLVCGCFASYVDNGKIGFSKDLFTVSTNSGLSYTFSLDYDNNRVYDEVRSKNQSFPSLIGLGWSTTVPYIFRHSSGNLQLINETGVHLLLPNPSDVSRGTIFGQPGWVYQIIRQNSDDYAIMGLILQTQTGIRYHYGNTSGFNTGAMSMNGLSYTYATQQLRDNFSSSDRLYTYEWMLTKIESYDKKDSITFEYYGYLSDHPETDQFAVEHVRVPVSGGVLDRYVTKRQYLKTVKSANRSQIN